MQEASILPLWIVTLCISYNKPLNRTLMLHAISDKRVSITSVNHKDLLPIIPARHICQNVSARLVHSQLKPRIPLHQTLIGRHNIIAKFRRVENAQLIYKLIFWRRHIQYANHGEDLLLQELTNIQTQLRDASQKASCSNHRRLNKCRFTGTEIYL